MYEWSSQQTKSNRTPLGTPFSKLLDECNGILNDKKLKAVIPGGSSVPVVKGEVIMDTPMDYEPLMKIGTMLGSGGVIVMDETTCMVSVLERISRFYYADHVVNVRHVVRALAGSIKRL